MQQHRPQQPAASDHPPMAPLYTAPCLNDKMPRAHCIPLASPCMPASTQSTYNHRPHQSSCCTAAAETTAVAATAAATTSAPASVSAPAQRHPAEAQAALIRQQLQFIGLRARIISISAPASLRASPSPSRLGSSIRTDIYRHRHHHRNWCPGRRRRRAVILRNPGRQRPAVRARIHYIQQATAPVFHDMYGETYMHIMYGPIYMATWRNPSGSNNN